MNYFAVLLILLLAATNTLAQISAAPRIAKRVRSETQRNSSLEKAIIRNQQLTKTEDNSSRYYYNYVDLNNDGNPEVLVYLFDGHFCGSGGCDALLFAKQGNKYRLINSFEPARNPIIVSTEKTNGWYDLIFFNRGGGIIPGEYSVGKFNGKRYPSNPTVEKDAPLLKKRIRGTAYLLSKGNGDGFPFRF